MTTEAKPLQIESGKGITSGVKGKPMSLFIYLRYNVITRGDNSYFRVITHSLTKDGKMNGVSIRYRSTVGSLS
jgi:hypothetical protein